MDTQTLSSIAQRGQSQLEGTVAAARNVLSHFAADVSSQQRDGVSEPNGQSAEFTVQTFVSAKDVYLACSRGLRETIGEIGNRRAMRGEEQQPDASDEPEVLDARKRVQDLRSQVKERNQQVKTLMLELTALLDDLNMADSVKARTSKAAT